MTAYYNENNAFAAEWLRDLIKRGLIADGFVDERSICDVRPGDLDGYEQVHFFAGIGGWSLAARLTGVRDDARIWTGSCPCQPFSNAGKHLGSKDHRHLWPEMLRLVSECRPPVVLGEQVASKAGRQWLSGVRTDLEELRYRVGGSNLCAAGIGLPHIRQRLYWVAVSESPRGCGRNSLEVWDCKESGRSVPNFCDPLWVEGRGSQESLCVSDVLQKSHGVPGRVGLLHGFGNAIVPPLAAEFIGASLDAIAETVR